MAAIAAALTLVGLVQAVDFSVGAAETAEAADLSQFDPGRIIDDSVFFNGNAMTAREVQDFLQSKRATCTSGYTCLKDYRENTINKAADPMCAGYRATAYESAADIIAKVGQSCGISQKTILVTLQKEQGLVTAGSPTGGIYRKAMGMGCPDTAECDSAYYGFFNQVYEGARALKRYTHPVGTGAGTEYSTRFDLMYPVGRTSEILYNPNRACGTRSVFVTNQATHALYVYTPYTPNASALASGYGSGDSCGAYGNRNFYNYFTDWFGSTRGADVAAQYRDYYTANSSWLGYPTAGVVCGGPSDGCSQSFTGGEVASTAATGVHGVRTGYLGAWSNYGRQYDVMGYPTTERVCDMGSNACRQEFQGGWVVYNATIGHRVVLTAERQTWGNWGREYGMLGFPTADRTCVGAMCYQEFNGGWVVTSSAGGIRVVPTAVRQTWSDWGRELGLLGLPIADPTVPGGSTYTQAFQGGTISVKNGVASVASTSDPWANAVIASPWLGTARSNQSCTLGSGACYQDFVGGWVVKSAAGVFAVPDAVRQTWSGWGREYGILGFPSGAPSAPPTTGNYTQAFQGGVVTVTGGNAAVTSTTDPYFNAVLSSPWLGASRSNLACVLGSGACYQDFAGGWVVKSPAGVFAVPDAVRQTWSGWGREYGILGFPSGAPSGNVSSGNYTQAFQGGVVTVTGGVAAVTSATDPWFNVLLTTSWLGASRGNQSCTLGGGGCYQEFANGWIVRSSAGAFAVPNAVRGTWSGWGREYGILGFPSGAPSAAPASGNYTQAFQGGVVTVTGGVAAVTSATDPWFNTLLTTPWLGASRGNQSCTLGGGGCYQEFANGWLVKSSAGAFAVPNAVRGTWSGWGREYGILGFPSGAPSAAPSTGNYTQAFQGGVVTVSNGVGTVTSATDPWFNTLLTTPWLGAANGNQSCTLGSGGCYQEFANGWLVKSSAGAFAVPNGVRAIWSGWGREYGILGFPSGAPSAAPASGNYTQAFQGGVITVANGVAAVTSATDPWFNTLLTTSWLGAAKGNQLCTLGSGGCYQEFANGWIVRGTAGVYTVTNAVRAAWGNWGREYGTLGYPRSAPPADATTGTYTQAFQGGSIAVVNGAVTTVTLGR